MHMNTVPGWAARNYANNIVISLMSGINPFSPLLGSEEYLSRMGFVSHTLAAAGGGRDIDEFAKGGGGFAGLINRYGMGAVNERIERAASMKALAHAYKFVFEGALKEGSAITPILEAVDRAGNVTHSIDLVALVGPERAGDVMREARIAAQNGEDVGRCLSA
jgi:hypothetical protein